MRKLGSLIGALLLAAPAQAAAEGGDSNVFLFQVINFLILIAALVYFGRKPIRAYFDGRREAIMSQLEEAAELHREAEETHARLQRQLVELDREVEEIRSTAQERAEREASQILADAQAAADRIARDATATVEQELRRAQDRLRAETAELAIELAAGILRDQVNDQDRNRLLDEFISRIEEAPGSGVTEGSSN